MAAGRHSRCRHWLAAGTAAVLSAAAGAGNTLRAEVPWQPLAPQQTDGAPMQVPFSDGGSTAGHPGSGPAVIWNPEDQPVGTAAKTSQTVTFEPIPEGESVAGQSQAPTTVEWVPIPGSETLADGDRPPGSPPPEALAIESQRPSLVPELPPPPQLQALNRSIAFSDGLVGPDISLRLPNGFRWSQRWFGDFTVLGYSYQEGRQPGEPFIPAINSGKLDGWAILHTNILQTDHWSLALNTSFRSLQNDPNIPGGRTGFTDGISSGFRLARAIGDHGGIALGGEQVIQWDDRTDTGRNLYLVASNGWWLGEKKKTYPLFIASGGFGTGRFATFTQNDPAGEDLGDIFDFTCITVERNRKLAKIDENLCWGPFGSVSLVFNEWWGTFVEYVSGRATLGVSTNLTAGIPLRLTAGVHFARENEIVPPDELRWIVEASLGF